MPVSIIKAVPAQDSTEQGPPTITRSIPAIDNQVDAPPSTSPKMPSAYDLTIGALGDKYKQFKQTRIGHALTDPIIHAPVVGDVSPADLLLAGPILGGIGYGANKLLKFANPAAEVAEGAGLAGKIGEEAPKVLDPRDAGIKFSTKADADLATNNPLKPKLKLNKDGTFTNLDTGTIVDKTGKDVSAYPEGLRTSKGKVKITLANASADFDNTPTLPRDLQGAKPRYNIQGASYSPKFESDLDKAAYITAQINPSKRDADYLKFVMDNTGLDEQGARDLGKQIKGHVKASIKNHITNGGEEGNFIVPKFGSTNEITNQVKLPAQTPKINTNSGEMPNVKSPEEMNSSGGGGKPPKDFSEGVSDPSNPEEFSWSNYWNKHSGKDKAIDIANMAKSMQTTLDLSAPLRQGRALAHKKEFWTSLNDMFKSAGSEEGYKAVRKTIETAPRYGEATKAGLSLTDLEGDLGKREEQFASRLAEHIPGYGKLVRGSGRAYTGFLDKLRMDLYQNMADGWEKAGVPYEPKELADFINTASGRGRLFGKKMESAAPLLNTTFYSPRMIAARTRSIGQALNPKNYMAIADKGVRQEYLKSAFALVGSTALMGKVASMIPSVTVSANPTSSDFGKIKIGNTRHDLMGGFQQYIVLATRLATKSIDTTSGKQIPIDSNKFGMPTTASTLGDFGRNKLSPVLGATINSIAGKDPVGNDTNVGKEIGKLYIPMLAQDIYDIYQDDPTALANAIPDVFGDSVQTFSPRSSGKGKFAVKMPKVKVKF